MNSKIIIIGISGKKQSGKSDLCSHLSGFSFFASGTVDVQFFSFAYPIKELCINVLGLSRDQCYGSDDKKNELTKYKWKNLPYHLRSKSIHHKEYITAREIMQIIGTDIFRDFFDKDVWVDTTFREIEKKAPRIAIIPDVRFPGEVNKIIEKGGHVIRLTRNVIDDAHESETILDDYDFESGKRCYIIDNKKKTLDQQRTEAENIFKEIVGSCKIEQNV